MAEAKHSAAEVGRVDCGPPTGVEVEERLGHFLHEKQVAISFDRQLEARIPDVPGTAGGWLSLHKQGQDAIHFVLDTGVFVGKEGDDVLRGDLGLGRVLGSGLGRGHGKFLWIECS